MSTPRTRRVLAAALAVSFWCATPTSHAQDGSGGTGDVAVDPGDHLGRKGPPTVKLDARHRQWRGADPGSDAETSSGRDGGEPVCRVERIMRLAGEQNHPKAIDALKQLYPERYLGSRGGDESKVFQVICDGEGGGFVVGDGDEPADAVALPSPAELARRAREQLRLPLPDPRMSPRVRLADGRSATLVNEPTWLWTEPGVWRPRSERVRDGPVWAEATARPVSMRFDSGMGSSGVTCDGPGTRYQRSFGLHAASPDCGFTYRRSSYGLPGQRVRAEFAITWSVSWRGSSGDVSEGGELPEMTSRATESFAVAEAQSLRAG